jgi:MFS transporter, DHA1 family, multidrug resistance protein
LSDVTASWRKNLVLIALAEFIVILGFFLFGPLLPLYLQQLGNLSSAEAAFWSGIALGGSGLAMFLSAPVWGVVSDRWGRKPMLLRAQIGGAVLAALFILAPNVYMFVGLRILQGLFTGTVAAASALLATLSPRDKLPLTMGTLLAAVYGGTTIGPLIGGFLASAFGFKTTFLLGSLFLLAGALIILFFVKENFQRPEHGQRSSLKGMVSLATSRDVLPLLLVIAAINIGPQMAMPVMPLVLDEMSAPGEAARSSGLAFALLGVTAAASSIFFGRLNGRVELKKILVMCCLGTGLLYLPPVFASSAAQLVFLLGITGLLTGGIMTSSNSLVGLAVPAGQQGIAYGLAQSAMSLGTGVGPILGGGLAPLIGLRPVFVVAAGIFVVFGLLAGRLLSKQHPSPLPPTRTRLDL